MTGALSPGQAAILDVVAWAVLGVVIGYVAHRIPTGWLEVDRGPTHLLRAEQGGRLHERYLAIGAWQRRLPDAGTVFAGGRSKRSLASRRPGDLERLAAETRRAELTHWALLAATPAFALWNPWWLTVAMAAYALVANLPCLLAQRYNRARLERILARRADRSARIAS